MSSERVCWVRGNSVSATQSSATPSTRVARNSFSSIFPQIQSCQSFGFVVVVRPVAECFLRTAFRLRSIPLFHKAALQQNLHFFFSQRSMNASKKEDEGDNLLAEAEKKLSARGGFFKSLMGLSSANKEEAAETFVKAANCFKLAKAWLKAGSALEKAAESYADISDMEYEAASKYSEAGKAYKNSDVRKAIAAYENAINLYSDAARFQQCARLKKEVAEIFEAESNNAGALAAYNAAADFYDMDDAKSNANSMRVKVASLNALEGKFAEAAEMYESIAENALSSSLLKYGAREHLLRAGMCRLCMSDVIGAQRALEKYDSMDPTFATSREGRLLEAIVKAVDEGDVDAFTNNVYEYDSMSKLDEWKTTILLKIKNNIRADEDDLT